MSAVSKHRAMAKAKITRVKTFVDENPLESEQAVQQYEARLSMLDAAFISFTDYHNEVVAEAGTLTDQDHEDYFIPVEQSYLETKSALHVIIQTRRSLEMVQPVHQDQFNPNQLIPKSEIRLPRLSLPSFSGDYSEWTTFFDLFKCTVDQNMTLTNAQRLQYLKSVLKGDALHLIQHFSITDDNYVDAWDKLQQRYNKKKHIIYNFIKKFTELPNVNQVNAGKLRHLTSTSDVILRGITSLGYESRDPWIIYLLLQKMDPETQSMWSLESSGNDEPTQEEFFKFLEKRCDALESCPQRSTFAKPNIVKSIKTHTVNQSTPQQNLSSINSFYQAASNCSICSGEKHNLYHCRQFKGWNVSKRREFVNKNKYCYNCLSSTHAVGDCKNPYSCNECKLRHHTLLHVYSSIQEPSTSQASSSQSTPKSQPVKVEIPSPKPTPTEPSMPSFHIALDKIGILPTAIVNARDIHGKIHQVRALLDSAADSSLITESCMKRLQLPRRNGRRPLTGVAAVEAGTTKGLTNVTIFSRFNSDVSYDVEAYVLPTLTANIPSENLHLSDWDVINSVHLADPGFAKPGKIDIIIGTDFFMSLLRPGQIDSKDGRPIVTNTVFGWVFSGKIRNASQSRIITQPIQTLHFNVDWTVRNFWEIEEIDLPNILTEDEKKCESHFNSSFERNEDGRYTVRLPFNDNNTTPLGDSIYQAISRMKSMERRFQHDEAFMDEYTKFMNEYIDLGHMEEVPEAEIKIGKMYYLPHHAVIKESSTSTKLRVVFDASSKTSTGISLNDKLLVGPTIQDDLFTTIVRFRTHKFVFTADIAKMYRQIRVHDEDTDYQRIIWRKSSAQPFKHYRLKTVTYGTASAPYLATRVIQQVGKEATMEFPDAAKVILRDFYVDDLMTGGDDLISTQKLQKEIVSILGSSGFDLLKWSSNNEALLTNIDEKHREVDLVNLNDESQSIKALGLHWQPFNDIFTFQVHVPPVTPLTKRIVLSDASKLFDPLGLVGPTIVKAKMFLQELWLLKLGWDDNLPTDYEEKWQKFRSDLIYLEKVKIKRWIPNSDLKIELHGFCDASELAYGAVVYARCTDSDGKIHSNIIASKVKVSPLKQISIPRLELCGALHLCRLMNKIKKSLTHLEIVKENLWTDSMIVLSWLASPPRRWQAFVANRTSEIIQSYAPDKWGHVKSVLNPADLVSRGVAAYDLIDNDLWWFGSPFLLCESSTWPSSSDIITVECPEERKPTILAMNNQLMEDKLDLISKYSCLTKLIRTTAWCLRFAHNSRHPTDKLMGLLSTSELVASQLVYIKEAQQEEFNEEIKLLANYKPISSKSKLISLHPFLDLNGLLRVGGRLENSQLSYSSKHQYILPSNHKFTILLVRTKHIQLLHANATLLSSLLLQQFWIIGLRNLVRSTVHKCIICFRHKAQVSKQLMGNLPTPRITPSRAFSTVGVDYAGPITIKLNYRRKGPTDKAYIALFVCMVTKAIHLEAVTSLTSEAFISAFKRFVSRRGYPTDIYSDNGTNFVGANRQLKELRDMLNSQLLNDAISHFLTNNGTNWHFNPPSAPHFGGIFEAGVKSVKYHLKRILYSTSTLHFEELTTVLTTIEACLNSRPLCVLSADPHAPRALTPGHFLIGEELMAVPEPTLDHIEINRLNRYQVIQKLTNDFWKRWSREYLSSLQPRNKWTSESVNIKKDDIVLVKEDNVPSAKWILGIVKETFPGADGKTRVVTLEHNHKQFQRPIHKLCLLPLN